MLILYVIRINNFFLFIEYILMIFEVGGGMGY